VRNRASTKRRGRRDYFVCPQCGGENWQADIPAGYGPDEEFDYDEFVTREFPERAGRARASSRALLVAVAVALTVLALLVLLLLSRR